MRPDYNKIYIDLIQKKFPEKFEKLYPLLIKRELTVLDIIDFNEKIFGKQDKINFRANQKHKSYDKATILDILEYQKSNSLNNTQVAKRFDTSRNSIAKWKKLYFTIKK